MTSRPFSHPNRRRGTAAKLIRARLCGGDRLHSSLPPSDGNDHRMKGKQCLSLDPLETFQGKNTETSGAQRC